MEYRIIKREGRDSGSIVFECQQKIMGIFRTMEVLKSKPSGWDVWCGTDRRSAIFNTIDEAKSFIEEYKNAMGEEVVFTC